MLINLFLWLILNFVLFSLSIFYASFEFDTLSYVLMYFLFAVPFFNVRSSAMFCFLYSYISIFLYFCILIFLYFYISSTSDFFILFSVFYKFLPYCMLTFFKNSLCLSTPTVCTVLYAKYGWIQGCLSTFILCGSGSRSMTSSSLTKYEEKIMKSFLKL